MTKKDADAFADDRDSMARWDEILVEKMYLIGEGIDEAIRQRNELRAEVERLKMQYENLSRECLGQYESLSAEVERLRAAIVDLEAALSKHHRGLVGRGRRCAVCEPGSGVY